MSTMWHWYIWTLDRILRDMHKKCSISTQISLDHTYGTSAFLKDYCTSAVNRSFHKQIKFLKHDLLVVFFMYYKFRSWKHYFWLIIKFGTWNLGFGEKKSLILGRVIKCTNFVFNSSCSRNLKDFGNAFPMVEKMHAQFLNSNPFFRTILV